MEIVKTDARRVLVENRALNCAKCKNQIKDKFAVKRRLKVKEDEVVKWQTDYLHETCVNK